MIELDQVDSTMAEAARRAPSLTSPTWIRADAQSAGRGRSGRSWGHPSGNLAATLVFKPHCSAQQGAQRSFLAANALFDALSAFVPASKLALKWPNDVLLSGGKVAGILLEASGGAQLNWLSIGIGVNLAHAPVIEDAAFGPTAVALHLDTQVEPPTPKTFLNILAAKCASQETLFATEGFDHIRAQWLSRAARLGEVITARTSRDTINGTFRDVDAEGNLVLETPKGRETVTAADVYF